MCAQHLKRENTTEEKSERNIASFGTKEDCLHERKRILHKGGIVGASFAPLATSLLAPLVISLLQS